MKRLRTAVIGAGVMGRHHANIYAVLPHVELVAIVEPDDERRFEANLNYAVKTYASATELLNNERIDAVSIAAPTSNHYTIAQELLRAGVHCLVEKPITTSVAEARELFALSQRHHCVLQVGHITRFFQAVQFLQERVKEPYLIEARRLSPHARIKDTGVILDLMIHDIDIILGLNPFPVKSISVAGHVMNGSPYEDVAAAQIIFENGCIARLLASRIAPDAERSLVIAEAEQTTRVDFAKEPYTEIAVYKAAGNGNTGSHMLVDARTVHENNPLKKEIEHFLARIDNSTVPIGTAEDDLRSLSLATRLLEELELSNNPKLTLSSFAS